MGIVFYFKAKDNLVCGQTWCLISAGAGHFLRRMKKIKQTIFKKNISWI